MARTSPNSAISTESEDIHVEPYARVVPAGSDGGTLRATLLFSPDRSETATGLTLNDWTSDIFTVLKTGVGAPNFPAETWSLPLAVLPVTYVEGNGGTFMKPRPANCGDAVLVRGKARLAGRTLRRDRDIARVGELWRKGIFENPTRENWAALAAAIAASLDQGAMEADLLEADKIPHDAALFGDHGQVDKPVVEESRRRLRSMFTVPQADLSVCLEFQRVEELLCSISCACGDLDARKKAELNRMVDKVLAVQKDADDDRGAFVPQPDTYNIESPGFDEETLQAQIAEQEPDVQGKLREAKIKEHARLRKAATGLREKGKSYFDSALEEADQVECSATDQVADLSEGVVAPINGAGDAAFDAAADAHDLASWPTYSEERGTFGQKARVQRQETDEAKAIRQEGIRTFFTAQSTPAISRLFGLAVDVEIDLDEMRASIETCLGGKSEGFLYISCPAAPNRPLPWTLTKVRIDEDDLWFWPATEAEVNLGPNIPCNANSLTEFDGHRVMGAGTPSNMTNKSGPLVRRFEVTSLDIRTATELELQRRKTRLANLQSLDVWHEDERLMDPDHPEHATARAELSSQIEAGHWPDLEDNSTFQTAGLALLDRGALRQAARKAARRISKTVTASDGPRACTPDVDAKLICEHETHIVLDAEDLAIGTRMDVGLPVVGQSETVWRSLTARIVDYGTTGDPVARTVIDDLLPGLTGGFGGAYRISLDSALQSLPARLSPLANVGPGLDKQNVEAVVEEAFVQWDGSPMGADTSSPDVTASDVTLDTFDFGREISLPRAGQNARDLLAPRLRYGLPYRFKLRTVYQGGLSVPLDTGGTSDARLDGQLHLPAVPTNGRPYSRFLRQHRIDPPTVLLERVMAERRNLPMAPERGTRVVVRSLTENGDGDELAAFQNRARPRTARRVLMPAATSFEEAERHGVFDDIAPTRPRGMFPRAENTAKTGFPVTVSTTRKGPNDERYLTGRAVRQAPSAPDPSTTTEYGDPVLRNGGSFGQGRYYPDPSADLMAFGLRRTGTNCYLNPGETDLTVRHDRRPLSSIVRPYPRLVPAVLDVQADTRLTPRANPKLDDILSKPRNGIFIETGGRSPGDPVNERVWRIVARLAPGESYLLDVWSVPSAEKLARNFSLLQMLGIYCSLNGEASSHVDVTGILAGLRTLMGETLYDKMQAALAKVPDALTEESLKAAASQSSFVGPGGHLAPPKPILTCLAEIIHQLMKTRPLPEIAAVRTLEITHATNRPVRPPVLVDNRPADFEPFEAKVRSGVDVGHVHPLRVLRPSRDRLTAAQVVPEGAGPEPTGFITGSDPIDFESREFVLDGVLRLALDTADGFEVVARGALPSSSDFDNRSRGRSVAARLAGYWPRFKLLDNEDYYQSARDLFGFKLAENGQVGFDDAEFTLLRVEQIGRPVVRSDDGYATLDLRQFYLSDIDPTGTWRVTKRHVFPDGKARFLDLEVRAFSRTSGLMRTVRFIDRLNRARDAEEMPARLSYRGMDGDRLKVALPATRRPAACDALAPEPEFVQNDPVRTRSGGLSLSRRIVTRIRLGREWYSTGEGEKLGVVLWPPEIDPSLKKPFHAFKVPFKGMQSEQSKVTLDLSDFEDSDLGPGGAFVTRLGADPTIRQNPALAEEEQAHRLALEGVLDSLPRNFSLAPHLPGPFLAPYAFHRDLERPDTDPRKARYVDNVLMPVVGDAEEQGALTPDKTLTVGLVCYEPRFDPEDEEWYVEIDLDTHGMPQAFVRFGLVRYQPNTTRALQVSQPVIQQAQILPDRHLSVHLDDRELSVDLLGIASRGAKRLLDDSLDGEVSFDESVGNTDDVKQLIAARDAENERPKVLVRLYAERTLPNGVKTRTPLGEPAPIDAEDLSEADLLTCLRHDPALIGDNREVEERKLKPFKGLGPTDHAWLSRWQTQYTLPEELDGDDMLVLFLEEVTWRRVSSYPIEPLPADKLHIGDVDIFSPAGPTYSAKVTLGRVRDL